MVSPNKQPAPHEFSQKIICFHEEQRGCRAKTALKIQSVALQVRESTISRSCSVMAMGATTYEALLLDARESLLDYVIETEKTRDEK